VQSPFEEVTTVRPLALDVETLDEELPSPEWTETELPPVVSPETPLGPAVTELEMVPPDFGALR
jgi:hypothetical protein